MVVQVWGKYMGDCQNYGPFLGPYYKMGPNTGPNLGDPKRDHNFDNPHMIIGYLDPYGLSTRIPAHSLVPSATRFRVYGFRVEGLGLRV